MLKPKIVIGRNVFDMLKKQVIATGFQYEIGGVLLGYKWFRKFYVVACTFPRYGGDLQATKMTFILNGSEHTEEMERIQQQYIFPLKPIGVWHSHITEDNSFSVQDRESNRLLVRQIGEMLSIIVIQQKENEIGIIPYYVSEGNEEICLFGNKKSDFV